MSDEKTMELLQIIRGSKDPEKAMIIAFDVMARIMAGESPKSIMSSYGLEWEEKR